MRTFRLKYTIYRVIEIVEVRWLGTKLMQICKETILQATKAGNDDVCFPHKYCTGGLVRSENEARILYSVAKRLYIAV